MTGNYKAKLPNKDQQAKYAMSPPNMYVLKTPKQASDPAQRHTAHTPHHLDKRRKRAQGWALHSDAFSFM